MSSRVSLPTLASRWALGIALVSWRYMWQTTPLHRSERRLDVAHPPPEIDRSVDPAGIQPWRSGHGWLFHRRFSVLITDARTDARGLISMVREDFEAFVPREAVRVHDHRHAEEGAPLQVGADLEVDMPGPWNGPVRVVDMSDRHLRLATLAGHLEAGQIEFRSHDEGPDIAFQIEAWARPATRLVDLLYARLRLAKEIQLNMWVRFCKAAARRTRGRIINGVKIETETGPAPV